MAIFDIVSEVAQRSVQKSESGDERIFGILLGEVTDNYNIEMPGRVCVMVHAREAGNNVLEWVRVAQPSSGSEWGHYFVPEVGDQVLVAFDQGIIDKPYIIGCIPKDSNKFLKKSVDAHNKFKKIITKNGNTLEFTDGESEDGSMDKISIYTPDKAHELTLDNKGHKITLADSGNNASIKMNTMTGNIEINANTKLTIKVGETISVTMNGTSGQITIKATGISADATGKMILKGGGKAELTGATVDVTAQGKESLSASGLVKVSGKPIKLG